MMEPAPIILFVYNRPEHTRATLKALSGNILSDKSRLFIYCDGWPPEASNELKSSVDKVRSVVREEQWCKEVQIIENQNNLGLAESVIRGVSEVVSKFGKVIVLEDDILTTSDYLRFMNRALENYKDCESLACISGYSFPALRILRFLRKPVFLRTGATWGWATWARGWNLFNRDARALLEQINSKGLGHEFNFNGKMNYTGMLADQANGRIDSWGICWYASIFLHRKLTLYSPDSFVMNIGLDGSGTHYNSPSDRVNKKIDFNYSGKHPVVELNFGECPSGESWIGRKLLELGFKWKW